jgi:gluconolactonase
MRRKLFSPIVLIALLAGCTRPPAQEPNIQNNPATSTSPSVSVESPNQQPTEQTIPSINFVFNSDSTLSRVTGNFLFTEGPAVDASGNVFFSDINAGKIYKWSVDGNVTVFLEGLNMPNGLAFDTSGDLIVCEGGSGRLISIDSQGQITVLADQYNGIRFN